MLTEQKHHTMRNATMSCLGTMWVLAVLLLCGCNRTSEFRARLMALDSVLVQHPDSVYDVMVKMEAEAHDQSQTDRMYYELLRADAQNKAYVDFTTDSIMAEVADWYDRHGTPNEQMRAHYLLGCTYRDLGDVPMELQCFLDATTKADTASKDCDLYTLGAVYGQMANIYYYQYLPDEELKALAMCEKIAYKDHDTWSAIKSYELRIRAFYNTNMTDSVLSITKKARDMYLNYGDTVSAAVHLIPATNLLIVQGRYAEANEYLSIYEKDSKMFDSYGKILPRAILYLDCKGYSYLHDNKIDSALLCFTKLKQSKEKEAAYKGLLAVYRHLGIPDSIAKYGELYAIANDSSYMDKNSETIEQMTAMYNYGRVQTQNTKILVELNNSQEQTNKALLALLAIMCACALILYMYRRDRKKAKNAISSLIWEVDDITQQLNAVTKEKIQEEEMLRGQLADYKTKSEETEHIISQHQQSIAEKEQKIQELQKSLQATQEKIKQQDSGLITATFSEYDIYRKFVSCGELGLCHISEDDWFELKMKFQKHFPAYMEFINSKKPLSENQRRVCILIRLDFREREMANIMETNGTNVNRIKVQTNEKLFGDTKSKTLRNNLRTYF